MLFAQTVFGPQTLPHAPQLFGSVRVSMQLPPAQTVSGALQKHVPVMHAMPGSHALPQLPQFFGSDCVLVHAPLQNDWPSGQTSVHFD